MRTLQSFSSRTFPAVALALVAAAALATSAARGGGGPGGEIVEEFSDTAFLDPESTALWNLAASGRLVAGTGLGGNGSDGPFVASGPETVLETDPVGGLFNFTFLTVPAGSRLVFRGRAAARVNVLRRAEIHGVVDARGGDGEIAIVRGQVTQGGRGGPGGGRGGNGNPNGSSRVSRSGDAGESAPEVTSMEACNIGGGERLGGGCPGARLASGSGSGGGGGHSSAGGSDVAISIQSGQGGLPYGDDSITILRGGSGGGGGGNDEDGLPFGDDDPGGAGGGGGGAIGLEVGRVLALDGAIHCDGGRGAGGFGQSGAGGGGSGGGLRIRAGRFRPISAGSLTARGALGGVLSAPGRPGGGGSPGRIRIESAKGPVEIDRARVVVDPVESQGSLPADLLGNSFGRSRHYDTGVASPCYAFDGSDPATGDLLTDAGVTDLVLPNGVPPGTSARILFAGAPEDPTNPGLPDLANEVGPVRDVTMLDGLRFIRYEFRFRIGTMLPVAVVPEVERVRIRFTSP